MLFTVTSSSKFFRENSKLLIEHERARQNKSFLNQHYVSIAFRLGIISFQNFCFSIVVILWLAFFASEYTAREWGTSTCLYGGGCGHRIGKLTHPQTEAGPSINKSRPIFRLFTTEID